jgi:hypothetical protein
MFLKNESPLVPLVSTFRPAAAADAHRGAIMDRQPAGPSNSVGFTLWAET